tara:strand:+ start:57 stop:410 length:354 start_codon:yes stop_codon:yes gene_type:complete
MSRTQSGISKISPYAPIGQVIGMKPTKNIQKLPTCIEINIQYNAPTGRSMYKPKRHHDIAIVNILTNPIPISPKGLSPSRFAKYKMTKHVRSGTKKNLIPNNRRKATTEPVNQINLR